MSLRMKARDFLAVIGVLATLGGVGVAVFFFSGFYSVAADSPDPSIINWALVQVRRASIMRHATDQPSGSLVVPVLVRSGARAYSQVGCTNCHGGPGLEPAKFSEGLNPAPNLNTVVKGLLPQQVFWAIKNGIKMTGMPSFGASKPPVPDQQIWAIVAFLKKVPNVSGEDYKAWSSTSFGEH